MLWSSSINTAQRNATYEDLLQVSDLPIAEIIDGELLTSPRTAFAHARAAAVVGQDLAPFDQRSGSPGGSGGWWLLFEPELHLGADILVPDLAGWRRERLPVLENAPYTTLAPDWICEIVSPSSVRVDRVRKMPVYAREGVRHMWLVDPLSRPIEAYRLAEPHWVLIHTGTMRPCTPSRSR